MRIAYLDCMSGISGDMTLGALIDAGAPIEAIESGIQRLGLPDLRLVTEEVRRRGFRAIHVRIDHPPEKAHRHLHHIVEMIDEAQLPTEATALAKAIFQRVGEAEAHVHGVDLRKVHFHEVGAIDSIADIVGCAIGFTELGIDQVVCSPIPTGTGTIEIAHGAVSVPAPATAELLRGVPLKECDLPYELTTPTGAAIATTMASSFGGLPAMQIESIGYGAGSRDMPEQANVLRLLVATEDRADQRIGRDQVVVFETNLDDLSPEIASYACERFLAAGGLDAFTTPVTMKKGRSAIALTLLCRAEDEARLAAMIFDEIPTLGIRVDRRDRYVLPRRSEEVESPWGPVKVKVATLPNGQERGVPEYESCRQIATTHQIPLRDVYQAALHGWNERDPK